MYWALYRGGQFIAYLHRTLLKTINVTTPIISQQNTVSLVYTWAKNHLHIVDTLHMALWIPALCVAISSNPHIAECHKKQAQVSIGLVSTTPAKTEINGVFASEYESGCS